MTGSPDELVSSVAETVELRSKERFAELLELKRQARRSVDDTRNDVDTLLGFSLHPDRTHTCAKAELHESHQQSDEDERGSPRRS